MARNNLQVTKDQLMKKLVEENLQLVAVMYADMAASTEHAEKEGTAEAVMKRKKYLEISRPIIGANGGYVVKVIGDEPMAVFFEPWPAIQAAVGIHKKLEDYNKDKTGSGRIEAKVAIDVGEAYLEKGLDPIGGPANMAARVGKVVPANEIYITDTLRDLVRGRRKYSFKQVDNFDFKGFDEKTTVWKVLWRQGDGESETKMPSVDEILKAMGYRILDKKEHEKRQYYLCEYRFGVKINRALITCVMGAMGKIDVEKMYQSISTYPGISEGVIITGQKAEEQVIEEADSKGIAVLTLEEFISAHVDFKPYLEKMKKEFESSEIPRYYIPLKCYVPVVSGAKGKKDAEKLGRARELFYQRRLTFKSEKALFAGRDIEVGAIQVEKLDDLVDRWMEEDNRNHLSILGDFGTGKTWFCQRYAYLRANKYLQNPTERIPVLISLRDYSKAYDVKQMITDALLNKYGIRLPEGYDTFDCLNKLGKLLLIFDGFDEMERRVSDYKTTAENFWELAKVVNENSKIMLTCRTNYFRHIGEEREILEPEVPEVRVMDSEQIIDLRGRHNYEVLHLKEFDDDDIKLALKKRLPDKYEELYRKIESFENLKDMATRPVLLDMIARTLLNIEDVGSINQATLYESYTDELLKRRYQPGVEPIISPVDKLFFVQELAWEMYQSDKFTIPFSQFPSRVEKHFNLKDNPVKAALFERDIRT
jgi:class 3 adenylate cyclase